MVDDIIGADEALKAFINALRAQTDAGGPQQASMYAVGESLGMDRQEAQRAAEALIGMGLVEVRTLAGDIGLSDDGAALCDALAGPGAGADTDADSLGNGPIMTDADRRVTETIVGQVKYLAGDKSWVFDTLNDLMADLKTIDAQLLSSRPKTAIIKECFRSIRQLLADAGYPEVAGAVDGLLGE
jgi:hypothetical protein